MSANITVSNSSGKVRKNAAGLFVAPREGLEPSTNGLTARRSTELSYRGPIHDQLELILNLYAVYQPASDTIFSFLGKYLSTIALNPCALKLSSSALLLVFLNS